MLTRPLPAARGGGQGAREATGPQGARAPAEGSASEAEKGGSVGGVVAFHVVAFAFLNAFLLYIAPPAEPLRLVYASLMLWVASVPVLVLRLRPERKAPLFPLVNGLYFAYFALPVFTGVITLRDQPYDRPEVTTAVGLALAGVVLMQVVFYLPIGKLADVAPRLRLEFPIERLVPAILAIAAIAIPLSAWIMASAELPAALRAIANATSRLPLLLLSGLFLLHLRGGLSRTHGVLGLALYALYAVAALATGSISHLMFTLAPMFFLYVAEKKRVPWLAGILCAVLLMPFAHTKHDFKREARRAHLGMVERIEYFFETTYDAMAHGGMRFVEDASRTSASRMSYLGTFAYVIRVTPDRVPYLEGSTYQMMFWAFVPRIVAPDKPKQALGQEFGHRYRLLNPRDFGTSYNLPQIVEMFINFGRWGVLVGMAMMGLYFRALYAMFNHGRGGDGMTILVCTMTAGLLNVESDASMVLVGGIHSLLTGFLFLLVVKLFATRAIPHPAST